MTQYSRVPEFMVEEKLAKTNHITRLLGTSSTVQVQAELVLLSGEVSMCITTLKDIQDSLGVLLVSLEVLS